MKVFIEKYKETVKDLFLPFVAFLAWNIFHSDGIFEYLDGTQILYDTFDVVICGLIPVIIGFILYVFFRQKMSNTIKTVCLVLAFPLLGFFTRFACCLQFAYLCAQEYNNFYIPNFIMEWHVHCAFLGVGIFVAVIRAIWLVVVSKLKTESRIKFLSYINKRALIFALMPAIFWIVIIVYAFLMNLAYD